MKVKNVMHRGVTWVKPDTGLSAIARKMRVDDIGAVPVGEDGRLIGMVTDRDIAIRGAAKSGDCAKLTAADVMTKPIVCCRSEDELAHAVRVMERRKIRRLPVVDAKRQMVGMLSLGDVSRKAPKALAGEVIRAVSGHHR